MKILYLDCCMGAAGDMLMAALLELTDRKEEFLQVMNGLGLPGVSFAAEKSEKCGIIGTHMRVTVCGEEEHSHDHHEHEHDHGHDHEHYHHDHAHHGMTEILAIIQGLELPEEVKVNAARVYSAIAAAESEVHGVRVDQIHFHEVGSLDAVADVVGVCLLMHWLAPERVCASAVHVGSGQVRCAHGILPVPAPATARILKDVPIYGGQIRGELCTPTGAALLTTFVTSFGNMPVMRPERIGYGMGTKDFPAANCVRAILGHTDEQADEIIELKCNLDDMSGEDVGFAVEQLFAAGALDVFTTPIGMKKNRPAVLLTCLCRIDQREKMTRVLFEHTTTLGVRETVCRRSILHRITRTQTTPWGDVRIKRSEGWGVIREKPEHDDLAAIARQTGKSLEEIRRAVAGMWE